MKFKKLKIKKLKKNASLLLLILFARFLKNSYKLCFYKYIDYLLKKN